MKKYTLTLFLTLFVFSINVFSAVKTWDGGGADNNWATAANWVGDVAPGSGDDLVFPAEAAKYTANNNLFLLSAFRSIKIEGGKYIIGGNPLSLTNGLTVVAGQHSVNTVINLSAPQTFAVEKTSITMIAALVLGNNALTLDVSGGLGIGLISGSGAITKTGLGGVIVVAATGYTGAISQNGGILVVDASIPNSSVTINADTVVGSDFNLGDFNLSDFGLGDFDLSDFDLGGFDFNDFDLGGFDFNDFKLSDFGLNEIGLSALGGKGTVGAVNVTRGFISPGTLTSPTATLNTGNLTFTTDGGYVAKIIGTSDGVNNDQLNVTGSVNLNNASLVILPLNISRSSAVGDSFTILKNDGTDAIVGTFLNAPEGAVLRGVLNTGFRITYRGGDGNDVVVTRVNRALFDFDGDGKSDVSVFRPSSGSWFSNQSTSGFKGINWGLSTDVITPGDFDGDGRADIAVYRPSSGVWFVLRSSDNQVQTSQFGTAEDKPVAADYDGDGKTDIAVYRPSSGVWYIQQSRDGFSGIKFGIPTDAPVPADFNGDGKSEIAVFRPSSGVWYIWNLTTGGFSAVQFGMIGDTPVAADYDGDGKDDYAVFRPSNGVWYTLGSREGFTAYQFGIATDTPVVGDYDGDGRADRAVYRAESGNWYIQRTTAGFTSMQFGLKDDSPIPSHLYNK